MLPTIKSWKLPWRGLFPARTLCHARKLHFVTDSPAAIVNSNPAPLSVTMDTGQIVVAFASPLPPKLQPQTNTPRNSLRRKKNQNKEQQARKQPQQTEEKTTTAQLQENTALVQPMPPSLNPSNCAQPQVRSKELSLCPIIIIVLLCPPCPNIIIVLYAHCISHQHKPLQLCQCCCPAFSLQLYYSESSLTNSLR
jgi:hypothetical protein